MTVSSRVPRLEAAGRQVEVLGAERVGDVLDGEPEPGEPRRIDQDLDLALAPADEVDAADAGDALDALLDDVVGELGQIARSERCRTAPPT